MTVVSPLQLQANNLLVTMIMKKLTLWAFNEHSMVTVYNTHHSLMKAEKIGENISRYRVGPSFEKSNYMIAVTDRQYADIYS